MAGSQSNDQASEPTQSLTSAQFSSPEADLRLRSADGVVFHVFSRILKEASPVFSDMLSLPNSEQEPRDITPIDVTENAEMLELVLRFLYPIPEPPVTTFEVLNQLMRTADKYLLGGITHSMRRLLVTPTFVDREPLRAYAIACMYGHKDEAKLASKQCLKIDLITQAELYDELAEISAKDLLRLIKLQQTRAASILSILNGSGPSACPGPAESKTAGGPIWWIEFKTRAKEEIRLRPLTEVIFQPSFLVQCVNYAVATGCLSCPMNYLSPATQARLTSLKERIDALPDTV